MRGRAREGLLRWYPMAWRARYGEELIALVEDQVGDARVPMRLRVSLAVAGVRERAYQAGIVGEATPEVRRRSGSLMVLVAWAAMTVAGAVVAKTSEHFAAAMTPASRAGAQRAYDVVAGAGVAGMVLVLIGALVVLPSLARAVSHGAWRHLRRAVVVAGVAWGVTAATTFSASAWGHHLRVAARNGADPRYTALAVILGLLVVVSITASCVAVVKVVTTIELSPRVLRAESVLAAGVAVSALAVTSGTFAWWREMSVHASWFLQGAPRGVAASAWSTHLVVAAVIMVSSLALSSWGMARVVTSASRA